MPIDLVLSSDFWASLVGGAIIVLIAEIVSRTISWFNRRSERLKGKDAIREALIHLSERVATAEGIRDVNAEAFMPKALHKYVRFVMGLSLVDAEIRIWGHSQHKYELSILSNKIHALLETDRAFQTKYLQDAFNWGFFLHSGNCAYIEERINESKLGAGKEIRPPPIHGNALNPQKWYEFMSDVSEMEWLGLTYDHKTRLLTKKD